MSLLPLLGAGCLESVGHTVGSRAGEDEQGIKRPSREEFLQMGVQHGGDYSLLNRGLQNCRSGTIKDFTYRVRLRMRHHPSSTSILPILSPRTPVSLHMDRYLRPCTSVVEACTTCLTVSD